MAIFPTPFTYCELKKGIPFGRSLPVCPTIGSTPPREFAFWNINVRLNCRCILGYVKFSLLLSVVFSIESQEYNFILASQAQRRGTWVCI